MIFFSSFQTHRELLEIELMVNEAIRSFYRYAKKKDNTYLLSLRVDASIFRYSTEAKQKPIIFQILRDLQPIKIEIAIYYVFSWPILQYFSTLTDAAFRSLISRHNFS